MKIGIYQKITGGGYDTEAEKNKWILSKLQELENGKILDAGAGQLSGSHHVII